MANEIYNSSYWGNGVCDNAIDWGVVYKDFAGCTPSFSNTFSLSFDGVDDYVECGTELGNSFGVTTNISISMWINPSVTSGNDLFFNIGSFSNSFGQIAFQLLSNKLYIKLNNGARSYNVAYTNTTDWQHLVFVYDGSNSANTKMYINNVEQSTTVAGVFPSSLDLSSLKTIIGGGYSVSYTYSGLQDEVAIFNTALTPANVTSIYNSGVPNDISSISGLTAWYRMGDNGSYKSPQWLIPENSNVANSRISNYSFSLDGVDDYIDTGAIDLGETNTISFWFKNNSANTGNGVIGDADNHVVYFQTVNLFYYPVGSTTGRKTFGGTNIASAMADTTNWHNLILIRKAPSNGISGYNDLACYLDGNLEGTHINIYTANINLIPLYIGKSGLISSNTYDGLIDEVSYYDNDQTANVSTIYNSGTPSTITGAVAHWKMGEEATFSTNWTIPDGVGSSDGTSANMTIEDRVGDAPNSTNNALSYNMIESDRETDVPT